jgi:LmbE family N-acetylglucosaminyl deacetylase
VISTDAAGTARTAYTLVAFHAHPDDESLLTGGTLAKAAAEGHRVVLVTATGGERGLAGSADGDGVVLARRRSEELKAAAAALGVHRVVFLGYADSGLHPGDAGVDAFSRADVAHAAQRLVEVLVSERADVLIVYDANGGYGHPDHIQVHRVGTRAAHLAGTPVVLEATVPAGLFRGALLVMRAVGHVLGRPPPLGTARIFSTRRQLTHRVSCRHQLAAKRAAMAAHESQRRPVAQGRVLDRVLRLPAPVFALAFGHEWFIEQGRRRGRLEPDVFAGLRSGSGRRA